MGGFGLSIGHGLGIGAGAALGPPLETFLTYALEDGANLETCGNLFTFTTQPSTAIVAGSTIELTGLTGSATSNAASLTVGGAGAAIFGSVGSWTQSTGTLVLTVASGQTIPTGSDTVVTFALTNPAGTNAGVTDATLSSAGYRDEIMVGPTKFLETAPNKFNINIQQLEADIRARLGDAVGVIAFGTTTHKLYVFNGSHWSFYEKD
jgi:hypothetical protein